MHPGAPRKPKIMSGSAGRYCRPLRCGSSCHHWGKAPEKLSRERDFHWATTLDCVVTHAAGRPRSSWVHPATLDLKPGIRNLEPETQNLKPETRDPEPETRNPKSKPKTRNLKPGTCNSEPETRNPEPGIIHLPVQLRQQGGHTPPSHCPKPENRNQKIWKQTIRNLKPGTRNPDP